MTVNSKQLTVNSGFSLIEILVVVTVFAVLGILSTQAILLTLRGTNKSSSLLKVRENLDYSLSIMERQLRNAQDVSNCTSGTSLTYTDVNGNSGSFSCVTGATGYIASGSAHLTSDEVAITACSITCTLGTGGVPDLVNISIAAKDAKSVGIEAAQATANTQIYLRTY